MKLKRAEVYIGRDKTEARGDLIARWQEEWDNSRDKDRWTHRLIGQLDVWLSRKADQMTYHLTQLLSGHGCWHIPAQVPLAGFRCMRAVQSRTGRPGAYHLRVRCLGELTVPGVWRTGGG